MIIENYSSYKWLDIFTGHWLGPKSVDCNFLVNTKPLQQLVQICNLRVFSVFRGLSKPPCWWKTCCRLLWIVGPPPTRSDGPCGIFPSVPPEKKTPPWKGLINKGNPLVIFMGDMGCRAGGYPVWELSKIFIKILIRNRSFGEYSSCFFFKCSMISSDGFWCSWGFNLSIA